MSRLPIIVSALCLIAAAVVAGVAWKVTQDRPMGAISDAGVSGSVRSTGRADIGGPFTLVDQNGGHRDESLLNGKWSVVFFGFTYCPDVCPTTLQTLAASQQLLGARGDSFQVVFITIDPARDTPASLKAYLDSVGLRGAVGLTGTPAQIAAVAKAYRVYFAKKGDGEDYLMDHSTIAYLMGPDGQFAAAIPYGLSPERTATIIRDAMQQGR